MSESLKRRQHFIEGCILPFPVNGHVQGRNGRYVTATAKPLGGNQASLKIAALQCLLESPLYIGQFRRHTLCQQPICFDRAHGKVPDAANQAGWNLRELRQNADGVFELALAIPAHAPLAAGGLKGALQKIQFGGKKRPNCFRLPIEDRIVAAHDTVGQLIVGQRQ